MDNTLRKYQLLSECYDNECFKSKVYLEMVNQYPNMALSFDDFSNMIYDVYNEFLQENIDYIESFCEDIKLKFNKQKSNNKSKYTPIPNPKNNKAISKINNARNIYYNKLNDGERKAINIGLGAAAAGGVTLAAATSKDVQEYKLYKQNTGDKCSFVKWVKMGRPLM